MNKLLHSMNTKILVLVILLPWILFYGYLGNFSLQTIVIVLILSVFTAIILINFNPDSHIEKNEYEADIENEDLTDVIQENDDELNLLKDTLNKSSEGIMLADNEGIITYGNSALLSMLGNLTNEQVIGKQISEFYDQEITPDSHQTIINIIADRQFETEFKPFDDQTGCMICWKDISADISIQKEMDIIITSASLGDFSKQLDTKTKSGIMLNLSKSINQLMLEISKSLNDVSNVVNAIAEGDLCKQVTKSYSGVFGQLKDDINSTSVKLNKTVSKIANTAETINNNSKEIKLGSQNLSNRSQKQASSLEETAASMEEVTSTVQQNADNSSEAKSLASNTQNIASEGGTVVSEAINAMNEINESSEKVANIVSIIDEIAFQTNLLALNASVEAARAGDHGRGFAVVASEVRKLAGRSANAAKEIKQLILENYAQISTGTDLVNKSGDSLSQIVSSVDKVNSIISDIANANQEQSMGIEQIGIAINQIDEVNQQNTDLSDETSSLSEILSNESVELNELIEFFNTSLHSSDAEDQSVNFNSARHAHLGWKIKLNDFLDGKIQMDAGELGDHHQCELGKWIDGVGLKEHGDIEEMNSLYDTHANMHVKVKEVVSKYNNNENGKAEYAFSEMVQYSTSVVDLLNDLELKVNK